MLNNEILGNNLKTYRLQLGLTQKELAAKMNIVRELYAKYECGTIELDYDKIILVCKLLDITPNDLFEGCV